MIYKQNRFAFSGKKSIRKNELELVEELQDKMSKRKGGSASLHLFSICFDKPRIKLFHFSFLLDAYLGSAVVSFFCSYILP